MKHRVISIFLCAALLLGLIFAVPMDADAVSTMKCSEDGVATLKQLEGFRKYPYADGGQYSVGYGSGCDGDDLARYQKNGISELEADALLRKHLEKIEAALNSFIDQHSLVMPQNRFDALLLFTYNVGTGWLKEASDLRTAVLSGTTGNDFLYYLTRWCSVDGELQKGLIERRLAEADLYLNGNYGAKAPDYYSYVILDANGGACASKVQGYDAAEIAKVKVTASRTGYQFLGWYTAKEGGSQITDLDSTTAGKTLYARWQGQDSQGSAANYQRVATKDTNLYSLENRDTVIGSLKAGETVTITMDYVDDQGRQWGRTAKGWVLLADTRQPTIPAVKPEKNNVIVTVTNDYVNVRKGPGLGYALAGKAYYGDQLTISEVTTVNSAQWGKYSGGWLSLQYTNYNQVKGNESTDVNDGSSVVIATGTVIDCTSLRVRTGPGTGYPQVASLPAGTYVELTQVETVGAARWGRIAQGWICLSYVDIDQAQESAPNPAPNPDTSAGSGSTGDGADTKYPTGKVVNCQLLNVRSAPGTGNPRLTTLAKGTQVQILETRFVNNQTWGHIKQGWVSMAYIQLDYVTSDMGNGSGVKGTVYNCTKLNIRRAPGTNNTPVGYLLPGNQIVILEETTVGNMHWGRTEAGWVCLDYVKLDGTGSAAGGVTGNTGSVPDNTGSSGTQPEGARTGVVVGTNALRIRSGAGTQNAQVGTLNMGTVVVIFEQTTVNGAAWGRTDRGWVCMNYIRLDAADGSFQGTVNTNGLKIRSAAGIQNAILGTYSKGSQVTVLETTSVNGVAWGRTDKGWICLIYVNR